MSFLSGIGRIRASDEPRVLPVTGIRRQPMRAQDDRRALCEDSHGPALYVTLSPPAQAYLDDLRRTLSARRAQA